MKNKNIKTMNKILLNLIIPISFLSFQGFKETSAGENISQSNEKVMVDTKESSELLKNPFIQKSNLSYLRPIPGKGEKAKSNASMLSRNPFTEINYQSSDKLKNLPGEFNFTGIATVGESKVVFISSKKGINSYEIGQEIGHGYKIISINSSPAEVKVGNGISTHRVTFYKQ